MTVTAPMKRIDDLARSLAIRSHASEADVPLERIARVAATPISRRRALGVFGGALITAVLPTSVVTPARAQGGCTACGVPHGAGCVGNYKCGQGALENQPVCCEWPGYFGRVENRLGGTCAQAGGKGETPPGGAMCCCDPGWKCGSNPGVAACECPKPCGNDCCRDDQQCLSAEDFDGGPICMRCPEVITDLKQCPNRVQRSEPNANGCGGEGIPAVVVRFLNNFGEANFKPACAAHDVCYGTCRSDKADCDTRFHEDLKAICKATYSGHDRDRCLSRSDDYYTAVDTIGKRFYEQAQRDFCQCCPDGPRDVGDFPSPPPNPRPTAPDTLSPQDQDLDVRVSCSGPTPCEGTLALSTVAGSGGGARGAGTAAAAGRRTRMLLLGRNTFSIPAGRTARVSVPLSRKGRRLLRKRKRLTVLATTRIQLANGKRVDTGVDSFVLKARRARERR